MKKVVMFLILACTVLVFFVGCAGGNGVGNGGGIIPPISNQQAEKFVGLWVNDNPKSTSSVRIDIKDCGKDISIVAWQRADDGEYALDTKIVNKKEVADDEIILIWEYSNGKILKKLVLVGDRQLKVMTQYFNNLDIVIYQKEDLLSKT